MFAGETTSKNTLEYVTPVGSVDAFDSYSTISIASKTDSVGTVYVTLYPLIAAVAVIVGGDKLRTYAGMEASHTLLLVL